MDPDTVDSGTAVETPAGGEGGFDMEAGIAEMETGLGLGQELEGDPNDPPDPAEPKIPAAPAPASASPAPSAPAAPAAPAAAPAPGAAPDINIAPGTWTAAAKAEYAALSPTVKAEIHKREQDMWKGLGAYQQEANFAKSIKQTLAPVVPMLQQHRVTPEQFIGNLTNAHLQLSGNLPMEAKRAIAANMLKSYGIDLDGSASAEPAYVDPEVKALREQMAAIQSRVVGQDQQREQEVRQQLSSELTKFATDPAHPYFDEVADDIAMLIRGSRESGAPLTLKDAYEKAVYANPVTRAKEFARLETEKAAQRAKEEKERVEKARKGARANVTAGKHQGSATAALGSMDDTMEATMAAIKARV